MTIIIIDITKYKETDAILKCVTEKGLISLTAKGLFDPKNKSIELNNILTIADVDFIEGEYKYPLIKRHKVLIQSISLTSDYYYMTTIIGLAESCVHLLTDEDYSLIYPWLYQAVLSLRSGINYAQVFLIFLAKILKISGVEFELNHCTCCGSKKDIVAFSFSEGGYVCRNCMRPDIKNELSRNQLMLIRSSFLAKNYNINKSIFNCEDAIFLLNKINEFISDNLGYKLNSIIMLSK